MSTPQLATLSVMVVTAMAAVSFYSWRKTGFQRMFGIQELLRLLIATMVAILFNQPEWIEQFQPKERPLIAVLWDNSKSMETRDVALDRSTSPTIQSRAESIEPMTRPDFWKLLGEKWDVQIESFSDAATGATGTDLGTPLESLLNRENLLGAVLVSDGDWNQGRPPVEAATKLRAKGVPVFSVATGAVSRLPDLELTSLDLPTFGVAGKGVRIPFTVESSLPRDVTTTLTMRTSDGETQTREVRIAAMGKTTDAFTWKPANIGDFTVSVEIPKLAEEAIPDNNAKTAPIAIRQEKLKVLVVESIPRWEYRYLRNALSRDPGVEVSCLLFHPSLGKPGGGNKDYIKQFPAGLEELSKFDVVFLGDVGVEPGQLTAEDCRLLRGLVEHQASGLVFMPGFNGSQFSLLETELGDLYPVHLDAGQTGGWGSRTPASFELTELGRRSLLTKLADTQEENAQVWEDLPGFQWYAPVERAKAGTDTLAVHSEISNAHGRLPLLVTRTIGAGKVLFMGTDGAWRWRKGVEDKYHYRFWGQVVRWMAYQRNMAKGESMRLFYVPDQPQVGQTLALHAHVMERSGEPLSKGDVIARVTSPAGKIETVRLLSSSDGWGVFQGNFKPTEAGSHQVTLACKETSGTLDTKLFVAGETVERIGKPARPEVLEEISRITKGLAVKATGIDQMMDRLAQLPTPAPSIRRLQLWSHPLTASGMILLLAAFWIWRKAMGLI